MPPAAPFPAAPAETCSEMRRSLWIALTALGALAAVRLALLFLSPIELYPDEAQYWAWSRRLDWGYFSKPPMIAWLIAGSTALGGDAEAWVRLPGWVCQTAATAFVYLAGRRLYGSRAGLWAAVLYALAPGVMLSSAVAATDAPLLAALAAATWAYAGLLQTRRPSWAAALGAGLGLALLSKYAAAYVVAGLVTHALLSREARAAWSVARLATASGVTLLLIAPNLLWNATHGFETVRHTAGNASWSASDLFNPEELAGFLGAQFGVFGPVPVAVLLLAGALGLRARRVERRATMLLCLLLPPLVLVAAQALLSRANANWAAAFMPPAAVLVGAWLTRPGRGPQAALALAIGSQLVLQAVVAAAFVSPSIADGLGLANGLKRARGWAATAAAVQARVASAGSIDAVATDDRFLFNGLRYYGRDWLEQPGGPTLRAWVRQAEPRSQAEATAALGPADGSRVLAVSLRPEYRAQFRRDFRRSSHGKPATVPLDRRRTREFETFIGEAFRPAPRPTGS